MTEFTPLINEAIYPGDDSHYFLGSNLINSWVFFRALLTFMTINKIFCYYLMVGCRAHLFNNQTLRTRLVRTNFGEPHRFFYRITTTDQQKHFFWKCETSCCVCLNTVTQMIQYEPYRNVIRSLAEKLMHKLFSVSAGKSCQAKNTKQLYFGIIMAESFAVDLSECVFLPQRFSTKPLCSL